MSTTYLQTAIEQASGYEAVSVALDAPNWVSGPDALPRAVRESSPLTVTLQPRGGGAPTLNGESAGGNLSNLSEPRRRLVAQIQAARAAAPATRLSLLAFDGKLGWFYAGIRSGLPADPTPRQITAPPAGTDPRRTRAQMAVWTELVSEGGAGSINAYDSQVVTWGRGLGARSGAMGTAMDHALADSGVREALLRVGIARANGQWLVVNTVTGAVEEGASAIALMAGRRDILAALIGVSEDPAHRQKIVDAQWQAIAVNNRAGDVPAWAYNWNSRVIQFVAHMTHGGPAYGWGTQAGRTLYEATGGDIGRVLLAWGRLRCITPESPSGAFKVSTQTVLTASWMRHMGGGVAADELAVRASGPLELTDAQIRDTSELREHLVLRMPEGGFYVYPRLDAAVERRLGPNVHTRYLQELNGLSMRDLLPRIRQIRQRGLIDHYFSRDAYVHAGPITNEERLWWAKDVVHRGTIRTPAPVPDDQVREAYRFLGRPVPAAQALDAPALPPAEVAEWERRMNAAAQRIDAAGHRAGQLLRGGGTDVTDDGPSLPAAFRGLQRKLSLINAWATEEEDAQKLLRDFWVWRVGRGNQPIPANLRFLFDYVGRSSVNAGKAAPRYRTVAIFGGGLGADGRPTRNWCTSATTKGVLEALGSLGFAPLNRTTFLFPDLGARLNGRPLRVYGPDAYAAPLAPGDMIMYLYREGQYGGHTVTVVEDLGSSFTHISGNTGPGIGVGIAEANRLRTAPRTPDGAPFNLARATPDKAEQREAATRYIQSLDFGSGGKLVYSIVRFSAIFAELTRITALPVDQQTAPLRALGLRRLPPAPARAASGGRHVRPGTTPAPAPPVSSPPPPPPDAVRNNASTILDYIKQTARTRARTALSVDTSSRFYRRLVDHYLRDYLVAPSAARGRAACETHIGRTFAGPATPGDSWEEGALRTWNRQPIPAAARRLRPALPAELAAATDVLSVRNRAILPYIDVPQLIGGANTSTGLDADVSGGGKNISQLMHWGTGVKYSQVDRMTMRELFLAYELWHLEAWDVFGEDPINDLIAEEAGRILGVQLRAGRVTTANLQAQLNAAFAEARAWVGTLLRARLTELDGWTVAETQRPANIWWGAGPSVNVWGPDTIVSMLRRGMSVDDVKRSPLVQRIIGIYTLVYEADVWEAAHGRLDNGSLIPRILSGSMDRIFQRMARGEPVTSWDAIGLEEDQAGYALENEPPASRLTWNGASPEQLAFKRRVYDIHVARAQRERPFVASVPGGELADVPGSRVKMRTAAAAACGRMLEAARSALADARARGDALAQAAQPIGPGSGYRSVEEQFSIWNGNFAGYYDDTRDQRRQAPGGEHGEQAAELTARHVGGIVGAPGHSLHNNGLAIDLVSGQGRTRLAPKRRQRDAWRASWAWSWLTANAARFDFFQNTSIDEPWHWEYRPPAGTAAPPAGTRALAVIPAGSRALATVPMLAAHHDFGPDLLLRWNAIPDIAQGVDVAVHLHGYSTNRRLSLDVHKLPFSGLDLVPPPVPAGVGALAPPSWAGRTRPTLCVLPRGRAVPGTRAGYDFPALVAPGGFASLVDVALGELASAVGAVPGAIRVQRVILTVHSGGGAALGPVLRQLAGTPLDPCEVQVFDALYWPADELIRWVQRRLPADATRLAGVTGRPEADMAAHGCGVRVLYLPARPGTNPATGRPWTSTEPQSRRVRDVIAAVLPAGRPFTPALARNYRVEPAGIGHSLIPYWYGGRLLADVGASVGAP